MYRIDLLNKISKKGLSLFTEKYEYRTDIPDPDGILVRSKEMKEMTLPSSLKAIARAGAGVNNIPIDKCSEKRFNASRGGSITDNYGGFRWKSESASKHLRKSRKFITFRSRQTANSGHPGGTN